MYTIKRSSKTRFENHIMKDGELVVVIRGGLNYEFSAETEEEIEAKASKLKNTTDVSIIMYPVEV